MGRSVYRGAGRWAPALLAAACLWSASPARAQFFPFWGQPPARQPPASRPDPGPQFLSPGQVRAVLAREGARLMGAPRRRGSEIVAIGRDELGDRKRFTLDATTGEILDITVLVRPEDRPPVDDLTRPDAVLPPPEHGAPDGAWSRSDPGAPDPDLSRTDRVPEGAGALPGPRTLPASPTIPAGALPAPKSEAAKPEAMKPEPPKTNSADSALSPIKPLRPAGAPKVEPLPQ